MSWVCGVGDTWTGVPSISVYIQALNTYTYLTNALCIRYNKLLVPDFISILRNTPKIFFFRMWKWNWKYTLPFKRVINFQKRKIQDILFSKNAVSAFCIELKSSVRNIIFKNVGVLCTTTTTIALVSSEKDHPVIPKYRYTYIYKYDEKKYSAIVVGGAGTT